MSLDKLLLNLKIIGCVPPHGRIRRAQSGLIAIEEPSMYASIKRFLFKEGRRSTVDEINQIMNTASEKSQDLMTSKFMELEEDRHPKFNDEYQKVYESIVLLEKDLQGAVTGIENLKMTYHNDPMVLSEMDMILSRAHLLIARLRQSIFR